MSFNTSQLAYKDFRETLKVQSPTVLLWVGAGLSQPVDVPSWGRLRSEMVGTTRQEAESRLQAEKLRMVGLATAAENELDYWEAFGMLKRALGDTSYAAALRHCLRVVTTVEPPKAYSDFWKLGIRGILTSNIDRFSTRSFPAAYGTQPLSEFKGKDARYQSDVLRGGSKFVVNLHGVLDEEASWVFTREQLDGLLGTAGFNEFLSAVFLSFTVLFIGVSADDRAAGGHLERLKKRGLSMKGHFWMTDRNDGETHAWAESAGLRQILYAAPNGDHSELSEAIADLRSYIPLESSPVPIIPSVQRVRNVDLPTPQNAVKLGAEEIRGILNKEAVRLLGSNSPTRVDDYKRFLGNYSEAIFRARWTSCESGSNNFFDYQLMAPLAKGGFGQVFRALDARGAEVAIKILHAEAMGEQNMLDGFRRGVRAMHILAEKRVKGIVPYIAQWEIPASVVMEYIDGPNLEQAVDARSLDSWNEILQVTLDLCKIIHSSHNVPEKVLHRDIRPANVMLRERSEGGWEVLVLDFDLSWHREAIGFSVNTGGALYGYMAPELTGLGERNASRNALVDSFGIGMTLFFLVAQVHPKFGQQNHADWIPTLESKIARKTCANWRSLPVRVARLVRYATQDRQAMRWDITRIIGELLRLLQCLRSGRKEVSVELLAEELAARCPEMGRHYIWEEARLCATLALPTGFTATIAADEIQQCVSVRLEWANPGETQYDSVKKFVGSASDRCAADLKKIGFSIREKHTTWHSCRVSAEIASSKIGTATELDEVAITIGNAMRTMQLKV